jgi:hypothetical protein
MRGGKQAARGSIVAIAAVLACMLLLGGSFRAARAAQDDGSVTVDMTEYDGSGVSGTAVLTDSPDGVIVDITLEGNVAGSHPAHMHEGTCDTMDPLVPIYPLADVDADGKSVTTVPDITLADITTDPFVINVHDSLAELPVIVSCGNIPVAGEGDNGAAVATPEATGVGGGAPGEIPTTGVGSAIGVNDSNSAVLIALAVLAVVLMVAGISLRRLEDRANTGGDTAI